MNCNRLLIQSISVLAYCGTVVLVNIGEVPCESSYDSSSGRVRETVTYKCGWPFAASCRIHHIVRASGNKGPTVLKEHDVVAVNAKLVSFNVIIALLSGVMVTVCFFRGFPLRVLLMALAMGGIIASFVASEAALGMEGRLWHAPLWLQFAMIAMGVIYTLSFTALANMIIGGVYKSFMDRESNRR